MDVIRQADEPSVLLQQNRVLILGHDCRVVQMHGQMLGRIIPSTVQPNGAAAIIPVISRAADTVSDTVHAVSILIGQVERQVGQPGIILRVGMPGDPGIGRVNFNFVDGQLLAQHVGRLSHWKDLAALQKLRFNRNRNVQREQDGGRILGFALIHFVHVGILPYLLGAYLDMELHLCLDHAFFCGVESPSIQGLLHFVKTQIGPQCVKKSLFALVFLHAFLAEGHADRQRIASRIL